jgi:hypothetical protein
VSAREARSGRSRWSKTRRKISLGKLRKVRRALHWIARTGTGEEMVGR